MKIFRINKIEEFFNTFPRATTILNQAEKQFSDNLETIVKKINVPPQNDFSGKRTVISVTLGCIVFSGDHELYYYDIREQTDE
jgi:hypothetical protein